jgi:hypothetical protein
MDKVLDRLRECLLMATNGKSYRLLIEHLPAAEENKYALFAVGRRD